MLHLHKRTDRGFAAAALAMLAMGPVTASAETKSAESSIAKISVRDDASAAAAADLTLRKDLAQTAPTPRFGKKGSWWISAGGGAGFGADNSNVDYNAFVGFSTFLVDNVEFDIEFDGWYFDQNGQDDSGAGNFNLLFRWHFISHDTWSVFVSGGAGALLATDEIPDGGSEFNFTPRAGMGATFQLGDTPNRLLIGARWQHISNARAFGQGRNPGRDAAVVYVGLIFPF